MSILDDLKERKVIRTAISYAVVSFVIMQIIEIVFPAFDFPQWTQQFVIILLFLGSIIINCINFMDGIDGLIAGCMLTIFSFCLLYTSPSPRA